MEKKLSRRSLLRVFGIGATATWLAACAPKVIKETVVVEKEVEVEKEVTTVVEKEVEKVVKETVIVEQAAAEPEGEVIFWGHDQHPLDLAAEGFAQKYPKITWVSPHPADWGAKLNAAFASGTGCPDLVWLEATQVQDFGCNDLLFDVTPILEPVAEDFHPAKLAETFVTKTGKHVGWPGDLSVSGYYYRYDQFEAMGYGDVDWEAMTYDDFILMAKDIAGKGKYLFCFPASGWSALFNLVLQQLGGLLVSQDGQQIMVGDEKGIEAMRIVKSLYDTGAGLDVEWWSAPYWASVQDGTLIGDFAAAWSKGFWEAQIKTPEQGAGYWRIAKFPGGENIKYRTGIWGGATLCIPNCAENKENAMLYQQYALGSLEGCALAGGWGIIPSYRPYLASSLFKSARSIIFGDWAFNEFWAEQEKGLSQEYYRPAGWGAVDAIIGREMMSIILGEKPIEAGMQEIVELATPDFERTMCKL